MRFSPIISGGVAWLFLVTSCGHQSTPAPTDAGQSGPANAKWAVTMDNIEACSCPTFCQCYFTGQPALHETGAAEQQHAMRFCRFNNAFRITQGHFGETKLDGMKFWMAGDLGGDFSKGQMDWCVLRFEPSATPQQREAAAQVVNHIFAVNWNSFTTGEDGKIDWQVDDDGAVAKLNEGKSAEIVLKQTRDAAGKPAVIEHVQFWAANNNSGFRVMKNEVEAYRDGDKPFEFKQTNGFFTTIRAMSSEGHAAAPARVQFLHAGATSCGGTCCGS